MPQLNLSHKFSYSQSYRRRDERIAPDDFSRYTETATISKVYVEKAKEIRIVNPLFMITEFRSKISLENPVEFAFFLANENIESIFNDSYQKFIDPNAGRYNTIVAPNEPIPMINPAVLQAGFSYRIGYFEIPEYSDFPDDTEENFPFASTSKIMFDARIQKQLAAIYTIKSVSFATNEQFLIKNTNGYEYLYLIPFIQKIQNTEIALAGRVNFQLEY